MHLYDLNRRVLLTPFHNMALISPYTTTKDVDLHTKVFGDSIKEIIGSSSFSYDELKKRLDTIRREDA
jgi:hypothetical protein